jgi:hypothetical protein
MSEVEEPFDPKKLTQDLMKHFRETKEWIIKCTVDISWTGFYGKAPFTLEIKRNNSLDRIFICKVFAKTREEAMETVMKHLPVENFINE